ARLQAMIAGSDRLPADKRAATAEACPVRPDQAQQRRGVVPAPHRDRSPKHSAPPATPARSTRLSPAGTAVGLSAGTTARPGWSQVFRPGVVAGWRAGEREETEADGGGVGRHLFDFHP